MCDRPFKPVSARSRGAIACRWAPVSREFEVEGLSKLIRAQCAYLDSLAASAGERGGSYSRCLRHER